MTDVNRFEVGRKFAEDPAMIVCDCEVLATVVTSLIYLKF